MRTAALVVLLAVPVGACGGGGGPDELRPAEEARAERAVEGEQGAFGEPVDVGDVSITLSDPVVGGDQGGPWLQVVVRVENRSDKAVGFVDAHIYCAGNDEGGGWLAGSTFDLLAGIPPETFDDGDLLLLLPGDGRYGEPRPDCSTPAHIVVTPTFDFISDGSAVWKIPDSLVKSMNEWVAS
jgi:hypothetical protein